MPLSANEQQFVQGVSQGTGIDPRVLVAWIASEGHPGDQFNNYMNITAATAAYNKAKYGAPGPSGSTVPSSNPTAEFGSVQDGITATISEINSLGLQFAGQSPRSEIATIAASGWASGHYGGPGGPNFVATFNSLYPGQVDSQYQGVGKVPVIDPGRNPNTVGGPVGTVVHTGEGVVNSVTGGLSFFTSWRFAEIVGGALLLLLGLFLVGKQFGVAPPVPIPVPV